MNESLRVNDSTVSTTNVATAPISSVRSGFPKPLPSTNAATAYRAFFDDPSRSPATRKLYRQRAGAFFRWAESRGLPLETIDGPALTDYGDLIAAERSRHEASVYVTPVRGCSGTWPLPESRPQARLP